MSKLLPIGTTLYTIEESIADRWFSDEPYHFEIVSGEISRINVGGYKEYVVHLTNRLGRKSNLRFMKTSNLGKNFFLTYEEAVEFAEVETARYERVWHVECMRPWRRKNDYC